MKRAFPYRRILAHGPAHGMAFMIREYLSHRNPFGPESPTTLVKSPGFTKMHVSYVRARDKVRLVCMASMGRRHGKPTLQIDMIFRLVVLEARSAQQY